MFCIPIKKPYYILKAKIKYNIILNYFEEIWYR